VRNVLCMPAVFQRLYTWLSDSPAVGDPAVDLTAANRHTADSILNDLIRK